MKGEFAQALLLRSIPYGDADLVVTLLTSSRGPITLLARSAKKSRKRFGGTLDFFCLFKAQFRPPKKGMGALFSVEAIKNFDKIGSDVKRYTAAGHMVEVSRMAVREGDPSPEPFLLLVGGLTALNEGGDPLSVVNIFQARSLTLLGYSPVSTNCPLCHEPMEGREFFYTEGRVICGECKRGGETPLSPGAAKTLFLASTLPPERFARLKIASSIAGELRGLLQDALCRALGAEARSFSQLETLYSD